MSGPCGLDPTGQFTEYNLPFSLLGENLSETAPILQLRQSFSVIMNIEAFFSCFYLVKDASTSHVLYSSSVHLHHLPKQTVVICLGDSFEVLAQLTLP